MLMLLADEGVTAYVGVDLNCTSVHWRDTNWCSECSEFDSFFISNNDDDMIRTDGDCCCLPFVVMSVSSSLIWSSFNKTLSSLNKISVTLMPVFE